MAHNTQTEGETFPGLMQILVRRARVGYLLVIPFSLIAAFSGYFDFPIQGASPAEVRAVNSQGWLTVFTGFVTGACLIEGALLNIKKSYRKKI